MIITIGRENGSGGHEIGEIVAAELEMGFYDKKLISLAAEKSGYSPELVTRYNESIDGENRKSSTAFGVYSKGFLSKQFSRVEDEMFVSQAQVIRRIANSESAVIVGRCADCILSVRENTFNVFIFAPIEDRVHRIMKREQMSEADALKKIMASDKGRGNYYFRFTDNKWGKAQNYDLCINSSALGIKKTAKLIVDMARVAEFKKSQVRHLFAF